jgi:prepilin-type N-terminal cleavage/methylation domain-containing protein/prepilin-type processing-associated H-X9-DG protein
VSHVACRQFPLRAIRSTDRRSRTEGRSAFTLIELLVVLALMGLLLSLILPAVQRAREVARKTECLSNLHQIGLAMHSYHAAHSVFPFGYMSPHRHLLPQLDQAPIYNLIEADPDIVLMGAPRLPLVKVFVCPSDPSEFNDRTNYVVSSGVGEFFSDDTGCFPRSTRNGSSFLAARDIHDGLSNTIAFAEVLSDKVYQTAETDDLATLTSRCQVVEPIPSNEVSVNSWDWPVPFHQFNHVMTPNDASCQNGDRYPWGGAVTAHSRHGGGVNVLAADGAAKFLSESVDLAVWRALGTRETGDLVNAW